MRKKIILSIIIILGIVSLFYIYCISQTSEQLDDISSIILSKFNSSDEFEIGITTISGRSSGMSWTISNVYYDRESQQTKKSSDSIQLTKKGNLIFMEEQGRTIILKVSNIKLFVIEEKAGSKNNKRFEILICV